MFEENDRSHWWLLVAGGVVMTLLFLGCPRDGRDAELARTAHEAVQLARDARDDDRSAILWRGRLRLLSLAIGVTIPILVAAYIWRASAEGEIDPVEIIEQVEKFTLERPAVPPSHSLPASEPADVANKTSPPDTGAE